MEIVYKNVDELIAYENNSRTHSKEQIEQICNSINDFGFTNPILIDENNMIIAGHGRLEAGRKLGMEELPCIVLKDLTEVQKRAYVIADNKLALNAGWNEELLKEELKNLKELDFDLSLIGFKDDEIEDIIEEEIDEEPEVEFTEVLGEEHNYIVLYFDNEVDWLQAESLFDIQPKKNLSTRKDEMINKNMERVSIGRVVNGAKALEKLRGIYEN